MNATAPVLYAEDTEDDVFLMRRAFTKVRLDNPLLVVANGREAIRHLEMLVGPDGQSDQLPCLVMLDVKMPFIGGLEILKWMRQRDVFREVPVIMFSSSSQARDVNAAREHGANAYLVKPNNLDDLHALVEALRPIFAGPRRADGWLDLPGSIA